MIEGAATVDEAVITGESAPVIREAGGDRSAVTGGTTVLSDRIRVRVSAEPGRELSRPDDLAHRGGQAQEDPQRDRAQHPALRAHHHLPAGVRRSAAVRKLHPRVHAQPLGVGLLGDRAHRAARLPHSDDDRRPAQRHRHRRDRPHGAEERPRDERQGRRGGRRRARPASRQDGDHHDRQPAGRRVLSRLPASRRPPSPTPPSWRRWPTRPPRARASWRSP